MMNTLLIVCVLVGADPTAAEQEVLKTFRDEFVQITPGKPPFPAMFQMGRDQGDATQQPAHPRKLQQPFWMARHEVPQNLWEAVMGNNPSRWKGPRNSAEMLSHAEALTFCEKATEKMRAAGLIGPHDLIRLPSEAEWEYCARAGTETLYSFGDDPQQLDKYGWFTGNAAGNDPEVGVKAANPWQLYDMHGYLWEWTLDDWHDNYQGAPQDAAPWFVDKPMRRSAAAVLRGGSWKDPASQLTSTARRKADRKTRDDAIGLRCVLQQAQPAK